MKKALQCDEFCVFDDVLGEAGRTALWDYFGAERFEPVPRIRFAWRLGDGQPFMGPHAGIWRDPKRPVPPRDTPLEHTAMHPTGTALDRLLELLRDQSETLVPWVGSAWSLISGTGWVYPAGSGVSWHCDAHERYSGAFIYYAHPRWSARWGGELLVARGIGPLPRAPHFDFTAFSDALMSRGVGQYVAPKPDRLVVLGPSPHMVVGVSPNAGDSVRASVAGFFHRPDHEQRETT